MELIDLPPFHFKEPIKENLDVSVYILFLKKSEFNENERFVILREFSSNVDENSISLFRFKREIEILRENNTPYINKVLYFSKIKHFLILELLPYGDLQEYLNIYKPESDEFEIKDIFFMIYQICFSIQELHNKNIIHRDIKPENLFVGEKDQIVLGDFGLSRFENTLKSANPGTVGYTAPEVINNDEYSFPADIYSLGCTIFYMLFKKRPFYQEQSFNKTFSLAKKKNILEYHENDFSSGELIIKNEFYFNLIKSCVDLNPFNRPNINQIMELLNDYGKTIFNEDLQKVIELILNPNNIFENGSFEQVKVIQSKLSFKCCQLYYKYVEKNEELFNHYINKVLDSKSRSSIYNIPISKERS